jgi:hypothetical protein
MTSAQHRSWINSGKTAKVARPLAALRDRLRTYGYTVYDIGNTAHLDHIPPEDHTPYSETGWPITTPYGWVTAIDIMPPDGGLPSLQRLGEQLRADKESGAAPWIKYMNWGPTDDRHAVKDKWQPGHVRSTSSDTGHIHLSCRSDATTSTAGDTYDPIARLRGGSAGAAALEAAEGDVMYIGLATGERFAVGPSGPVLISWDEWVASFGDAKNKGNWPPVLILGDPKRVDAFKPSPAAAAALSAEQLAELVRELRAALVDVEPGRTGDEVEQAVARALRGQKFVTSIAA